MKKIILILLGLALLVIPSLGMAQERNPITKEGWENLSEKQKKELLLKIQKLTSLPSRIEIDRIYIPYKDWQGFLKKNQQLIRLRYQDFLDLVQRAQKQKPSKPEPPKAPSAPALQKLTLKGVQKGQQIHWMAECEIYADRPFSQAFLLQGDPTRGLSRLSEAYLDGQSAPLESRDNSFILHIQKRGRHLLKVLFTSPLVIQKGNKRIHIILPPAPAGSLELELSGHLKSTIPGVLAKNIYFSSPAKTRIEGAILNCRELVITLNEKFPKEKSPHLLASTVQRVFIEEGAVKIQAKIRYQPYLAPIEKIEIEIPQGFSITSEPDTGTVEKYWYTQKGHIVLHFPKGQRKPFLCTLTFTADLSGSLQLSSWKTGALVDQGALVVMVKEDHSLSQFSAQGLEQKPLSEKYSAPNPYYLWGLFHYYQEPYQLSLALGKVPNHVQAHMRVLVGWKGGQIHTRLGVVYSVQQGRLRQGRIKFPPQGDLGKITLSLPGRYQWEEERRELILFPKNPVKKGKTFYIELDFLQESAKELTLPQFQVLGVDQTLGYLALAGPTTYQLNPEKLKNLILLDPKEVNHYGLKDPRIRFAYRFNDSYEGKVTREEIKAHISTTINSLLTLKDQYTQVRSQMTFEIKNAPTSLLEVEIPPQGSASLEVFAAPCKVQFRGGHIIRIIPPRAHLGKITLSLSYRLPAQSAFSPLLPRARKVIRQTGSLAIAVADNLQIKIQSSPSVREIDSRLLPSLEAATRPFFACTYVGEKPEIKVEVTSLKEATTPQYIISSLHQDVQFDQKGNSLCKAHFQFHSLGAKEFSFTLPPDSELWSATLQGAGVKPIEREGHIFISLKDLKTTPATLDVLYLRKGKVTSWLFETTSPLPTPQGPVLASSQNIFLPDLFPLVTFGGNMSGEEIPRQFLLAQLGEWTLKRLKPFFSVIAWILAIALLAFLSYKFIVLAQSYPVLWKGAAVAGLIIFVLALLFPGIQSRAKRALRKPAATGMGTNTETHNEKQSLGDVAPGQATGKGRAFDNDQSIANAPGTRRIPKILPRKGGYYPKDEERQLSRLEAKKPAIHKWRGDRLSKDKAHRKTRPSEESINKELPRSPESVKTPDTEKKREKQDPQKNLAEGKDGKLNQGLAGPDKGEMDDGALVGGKKGQQAGQTRQSTLNLEYLFAEKSKIRGLNSLAIGPQMEGQVYYFQRSSGLGTVKIKGYSPSFLYPLLFLLGVVTFLGGWFIGRKGTSSRIFYLAGGFFISISLALLGGALVLPFANALALATLGLVAVFLLPGIFSLVARRAYGLVAAILLFSLLCPSLMAQEKKAPRVSKYKVYIPYNPKAPLPKGKEGVFISLEEYFKLLSQGQKKTETKTELAPLLATASYKGQIHPTYLDLQGSLTFYLPLKKRVLFPLFLPGARIEKVEYPGGEIPLIVRDQNFFVILPAQEKCTIKVSFRVYRQGDQYSLGLPPAGAGKMELENLDKAFQYSSFPGAETESPQKLQIPLGGQRTLRLTRYLPSSQRMHYQPSLKGLQISRIYLYPGYLFHQVEWRLENQKSKLGIQVDPSYKILTVLGRQGHQNWKTLDWHQQKNLLTLFLPPGGKTYQVWLTALSSFQGKEFALPKLKLLGTLKRPASLGVFAPSFLKVEVGPKKLLGRCDPALFEWKARHAYTLQGEEAPQFQLAWKEAQVSHKIRMIAYLEGDRLDLDLYLSIKSLQAPVYHLLLQGDPDWNLYRPLEGPDLVDQVPLEKGKILLVFSKPIQAKSTILRMRLRRLLDQDTFTLPKISLEGSALKETLIGIYKKREFKIEVLKTTGLKIYSGKILPLQGKARRSFVPALSLRTTQKEYESQFQKGYHQPKIKGQMVALVRVNSQEVEYRGQIFLDISQAPVEEVSLWFPREVEKTLLFQQGFQCGTPKKGLLPVRIPLGRKRMGNLSIEFTYSTPLPGKKNFSLVLPRVPEAYQSKTFVGIRLQGDEFSLEKRQGFDSLMALPEPLNTRIPFKAQLYFEQKDLEGRLSIEKKKITTTTSLPALVRSAHLTVQVDSSGESLVSALYRVQNHSDQFLKIQLPPSGKLWSVYVEGNVVQPSQEAQNQYLIPLPKKPRGDLSFWVRVIYQNPQKLSSFSSHALPLPQVLHPPVDQTFLTLKLPRGYHCTFSEDSNLDPSSPAQRYLNLASQMYDEFMDLSTLSQKTGYRDNQKLSFQKRYLLNQQKLLSDIQSNIRQAEQAPQSKKDRLQTEDLRNKYSFYQESLQASQEKLRQAQSRRPSPLPKKNTYGQGPLQEELQNLDSYEKSLSEELSLALNLTWDEEGMERRELVAPLPPALSARIQHQGPSYFPQSSRGFRVFHFKKTGGKAQLSYTLYPQKTTQTGKVLVALLAALLLLLSAHLRNFLDFQPREDLILLRNLFLVLVFFGLIVASFIWYQVAALIALAAGLDIMFWMRRRKKKN